MERKEAVGRELPCIDQALNKSGIPSIMRARIILFVATITPLAAFGWPWGPSNFDECVIDESKKFQSEVPIGAMHSIRNVCRERFPTRIGSAPVDAKACGLKSSRAGASDSEKWSNVITSTRFRFMTEAQREGARVAFFEEHIAPAATSKKQLERLRREWDRQTIPANYVSCN